MPGDERPANGKWRSRSRETEKRYRSRSREHVPRRRSPIKVSRKRSRSREVRRSRSRSRSFPSFSRETRRRSPAFFERHRSRTPPFYRGGFRGFPRGGRGSYRGGPGHRSFPGFPRPPINLDYKFSNPDPSRCIGVFGLSLYTTERDLRIYFGKFGAIEDIQLVYDHPTGRSRGFGFIYYEHIDDAMDAKESSLGIEMDGHKIRVDYSLTRSPHPPTPGVYLGRPPPPHIRGYPRERRYYY